MMNAVEGRSCRDMHACMQIPVSVTQNAAINHNTYTDLYARATVWLYAVCTLHYTTFHSIPFHITFHTTLHINITHYNKIHVAVPYITICYHTTSHTVTMYNSTLPYITSHCHTADRHTYIHTCIRTLHCIAVLRCGAVRCSAVHGKAWQSYIHA